MTQPSKSVLTLWEWACPRKGRCKHYRSLISPFSFNPRIAPSIVRIPSTPPACITEHNCAIRPYRTRLRTAGVATSTSRAATRPPPTRLTSIKAMRMQSAHRAYADS